MMGGTANPAIAPFRAGAWAGIIRLAAEGKLAVPIAWRYLISQAGEALTAVHGSHPAGSWRFVAGG
jgi:hypothetical protein